MDADQLNTLELAYKAAAEFRSRTGEAKQHLFISETCSNLAIRVLDWPRGNTWNEDIGHLASKALIGSLILLGCDLSPVAITIDRLRKSERTHKADRCAALEAENARLRAEIQRLSGNGPLIDPSADPRLP